MLFRIGFIFGRARVIELLSFLSLFWGAGNGSALAGACCCSRIPKRGEKRFDKSTPQAKNVQ